MSSEPAHLARPPTQGFSLRLVKQGTETAPIIHLKHAATLIGRDSRCFLRLRSSTISRVHALVVLDGPRLYIRNLASRTGLLLNGQPITESLLAHGDRLALGRFAFDVIGPANPIEATSSPRRARPASFLVDGNTIPATRRTFLISASRNGIGQSSRAEAHITDPNSHGPQLVIFETQARRYALSLSDTSSIRLSGIPLHLARIRAGATLDIANSTCTYLPPLAPTPEPASVTPQPIAATTPPLEPASPPRPTLTDSFWSATDEQGSLTGLLPEPTADNPLSPPTELDWPSWDILPAEILPDSLSPNDDSAVPAAPTTLAITPTPAASPTAIEHAETQHPITEPISEPLPQSLPKSLPESHSESHSEPITEPLTESPTNPLSTRAFIHPRPPRRSRRHLRLATQCLLLCVGLGSIAYVHRAGPQLAAASSFLASTGLISPTPDPELTYQIRSLTADRDRLTSLIAAAPTAGRLDLAEQDLAAAAAAHDAATTALIAAEKFAATQPLFQEVQRLLDQQHTARQTLAALTTDHPATPEPPTVPPTEPATDDLARATQTLTTLLTTPTTQPTEQPTDPSLALFTSTAQSILTATRQLTDRLLERQQQQLELLQSLSQRLTERATSRRQRAAASDEQYLQLQSQLTAAQRRLDAAKSSGLARESEELTGELAYLNQLMEVRLAALAVDPEDQRTAAQINDLSQQLTQAMTDDQQQADNLLESMRLSLTQLAASSRQLPDAQVDLINQIRAAAADLESARRAATAQHQQTLLARQSALMAAHNRLAEIDQQLAHLSESLPPAPTTPPAPLEDLRTAEQSARQAHLAAQNRLAALREQDEQALAARTQLQQLNARLAALQAK
jgi:hypothetical protein